MGDTIAILLTEVALMTAMLNSAIAVPFKTAKMIPVFELSKSLGVRRGRITINGTTAEIIFVIKATRFVLPFREAYPPNMIAEV